MIFCGREALNFAMAKKIGILVFLFICVVSLVVNFTSYSRISKVLLFQKQLNQNNDFQDTYTLEPSQPISTVRFPATELLSPWLHELSSTDPFRSRILEISRKCKEKRIPAQTLRTIHFKYSDKAKLVMCETPKVASTTWLQMLLMFQGYSREQIKVFQSNGTNRQKQLPIEMLSSDSCMSVLHHSLKSEEEARKIVDHSTTFMITRHPFERLVSAHTDKFVRSQSIWFRTVGKRFAAEDAEEHLHGISLKTARLSEPQLKNSSKFLSLSVQQQADVLKYAEILRTGNITFPQFAKFVTKQGETTASEIDRHWRPQVDICAPCTFNYSYVIRFENLAKESNRLLQFIQRNRTQNLEFPGKRQAKIDNPETVAAFKQLPESEVEKLRLFYANDFYILGHDPYRYRGYDAG